MIRLIKLLLILASTCLAIERVNAQEPLVVYTVKQADGTASEGYASDSTGDEFGDTKVTSQKMQDLPIGETSDTAEARVWIPFLLSEEEKALVMQSGMSVTLRLYLSSKSNVNGLRADIYGAGYRSAYRVNQNDFATLRKKLVPNAFNENSVTAVVYEFDVTSFVREEAARPNAPGYAFGFILQVHDESLVPVQDGILQQFKIGSSSRADTTQRPSLLIASRVPVANPIDPEPPDPRAVRILILGNSILKNAPMLDLGWAGNWGMGASSEAKDFSHLLMARIRATMGRPVIFMLHNIASWESSWSTTRHDIPTITFARDFEPDIIISCISENTGLYPESIQPYMAKYDDMISIMSGGISGKRHAEVVVRGSFWGINTNTDLALSQVAAQHGWPYVKCSDLGGDRQNQAWTADYYLGPDPVDPSVLNHPNDRGMQAITDRIWNGGLAALISTEFILPPATTAYYSWSVNFGGEKKVSRIGPMADFDGDGIPNLLEYAHNANPVDAGSSQPSITSLMLPAGGGSSTTALALRFRARSDDPDLRYDLGWSNDLSDWAWTELAFEGSQWVSRDASGMTVVEQVEDSAHQWQVTVRDGTQGASASRYVRLRVRAKN